MTSIPEGMAQEEPIQLLSPPFVRISVLRLFDGLQQALPFRSATLTYQDQDDPLQKISFKTVSNATYQEHLRWLAEHPWQQCNEVLIDGLTYMETLSHGPNSITLVLYRPQKPSWILITAELTQALEGAHLGLIRMITPIAWSALEELLTENELNEKSCVISLTEREQQVLQLLYDGQCNKQIAEKLYISPRTVKFHVGNIMEKYGVSSRLQLVTALIRPSSANG